MLDATVSLAQEDEALFTLALEKCLLGGTKVVDFARDGTKVVDFARLWAAGRGRYPDHHDCGGEQACSRKR